MAYINGNKPIVTDGLIYALDFGNHKSYTSGSTTANSLAYDQATTSVSGSPVLTDGILDFTSTKFVKRDGSLPALDPNGTFTVMIVGKSTAEGTLLHQDTLNTTINSTSSLFGFELDAGDFSRSYPGFTSSSLQHVTYRYSQGTVDTFINGIPVTASAANSALTTTAVSNALFLGSGSAGFVGSVAQFYVYNRSLSADEIYQTYLVSAEKNGLPTIPKPYTQDENLYKYLQTTGITDATTISAVNTFISDLKSNGLWNKMTAIYPFLTTATASQAVNLKDPGVLAVDYSGSYTASSTGPVPATATSYISTLPSNSPYPSVNSSSAHLTLVSYNTPQTSSYIAGNFGTAGATGGNIFITNGRVYHVFTTGSNTFTPTHSSITSVEVLVVAGGGGGGSAGVGGGGGGAGGLVYSSSFSVTPSTGYTAIIGEPGTGSAGNSGSNGQNSTFDSIIAIGGGGGAGGGTLTGTSGSSGGSGGGGTGRGSLGVIGIGGLGTTGQGNNGGNGTAGGDGGGGGGGAGTSGSNALTPGGGNGGSGSFFPQFVNTGYGSPSGWFAGGGGGGTGGGPAGSGGIGGGGGGISATIGTGRTGSINTGGGGGGAGRGDWSGGKGGSGIIIVSYPAIPGGPGTGIFITDSSVTGSLNSEFSGGITGSGTIGFLAVSRTGSGLFSLHKNNISQSVNLPASNSLDLSNYLGGINLAGGTSSFGNSSTGLAYASVGAGLTDSEISTYYNLVSQFQTNLKRQNTLLDNYSGAAAAYSLRRIGPSGYFGPAIRVRRDSDNALRDIGFTSDGQLDTVGLLDFVGVTGSGFVQTWYDQSGNGKNATQATAGLQPQIVNTGNFGGFVSFVGRTGGFLQSSYNYVVGQNFSSFLVVQNQGFSIFGSTPDSQHYYAVAQPGSSGNSFLNFSTPNIFKNGNLIGNTRNDMFVATTTISLISTLTSKTVSNQNLRFSYPPGGAATANDKYKELVIYDNQTVSRTGVESNINTNYKIYGDATASFDPDYQAFITATGITEPTQSAALETLVSDLKSYGLWDKMKAVYPMVTDKNNRLSDSQTLNNNWTTVSSSITPGASPAPDGMVSGFALNEEAGTGEHFIRRNIIGGLDGGNEYVVSFHGKYQSRQWMGVKVNGTQAWFDVQNGVTGSYTGSNATVTSEGNDWYRCALYFTASTSEPSPEVQFHLADVDGNFDYVGSASSGSFIWGVQFENGNLLGPYKNTSANTEGNGFTTGSMLDQMKFNLKDTGSFTGTYSGGWNPGYGGNRPNGTNGYMLTGLIPSTDTSQDSVSIGVYSRTNNTSLTARVEMGIIAGSSDFLNVIRWDGSLGSLSRLNNGFVGAGYIPTKTSGFFTVSRTASNVTKKYEDGTLEETVTTTSNTPTSVELIIGAVNTSTTPTYYDSKENAFSYISDGLTDYEAKALYWIVQKFQTTLGRQVY